MGVLFTGIILTASGPKVLEYNVRFGDPEAQTVIPLISRDTDLAEVMMACIEGRLSSTPINICAKSSAVVVVASGGYPGTYRKDQELAIDSHPGLSVRLGAELLLTDIYASHRGATVIPCRNQATFGQTQNLWRTRHRCFRDS